MAWDSTQYLKFAKERKQPCLDLIARLDGTYHTILDLGCGPANSTANLAARFPQANITGFDADDNMLSKAKADHPEFTYIKGYAPGDFDKLNTSFDLVFSNACIHWIPKQEQLIASAAEILCEGGTFAVQLPLTDESPFYRILYRLIDEKWPVLKSVKNFHNLDAAGYYNALSKHFSDITIWKTDYYHLIDGKSSVLEWYKGSGLRPYLAKLSEAEQAAFLSDLQAIIDKEYDLLSDGKLFLIMPRLFFIAKK